MAIGDVLPKEYGYVVIVVVFYCVLNFWMAFQVGGARKRFPQHSYPLFLLFPPSVLVEIYLCIASELFSIFNLRFWISR